MTKQLLLKLTLILGGGLILASCLSDQGGTSEPSGVRDRDAGGGGDEGPGSGDATRGDLGSVPARPPAVCDPGRVTIHRLNRAEYDNTVRDLLGDQSHPAEDFPSDDHGHGFDNNADVLSLSPLLIEKYEIAAMNLVDEALRIPRLEPEVFHFEAEELGSEVGAQSGDGWNVWSNGEIVADFRVEDAGEHRLSVRAAGDQAGDEPARMAFLIDRAEVIRFDVPNERDLPETYEHTLRLEAGFHTFAAAFLNDYYQPNDPDPDERDRNLHLDWLRVEGPLDAAPLEVNVVREALLTCDPAEEGRPCVVAILSGFAKRAWRRPVTDDEVGRFDSLVGDAMALDDTAEEALRMGLVAILLSPHFLFRVEVDPDPSSLVPHPVTDHELASRLSYFLWSSMPDETLLALAGEGRLSEPEVLAEQVDRMLADPKSAALVDNFAGQWLRTRALADLDPDYERYGDFDEQLRESMRAETEIYFQTFLDGDLDLRDLLDSGFSHIDARLAIHYGMEVPGGGGFGRVELAGTHRNGLLTQAAILSVTSHRTRTSPVRRGLWVLENLLCLEPPPPPPNVPPLSEPVDPEASLRDRMEQHRSDPACAGCHALMDPLGFGLEHFDAIGAWRDDDDGFPIDSAGQLPDGRAFEDATELGEVLRDDPDFARCVIEQVFTYGLGRGPVAADACALDGLGKDLERRDHRLGGLVRALVESDSFTKRRGEPGSEGAE